MPQAHLFLPLLLLLGCFSAIQGSAPDFRVQRWTNPIPYSFDSQFTEEQKSIVRESLKTFEENSCLKFEENPAHEFRIQYTVSDRTCAGDIVYGREYDIANVRLLKSCIHASGVQHETMHVLGFRHTQVRNDRDNYVVVDPSVLTDSNYKKLELSPEYTDYGIPYEFNSLLHYSPNEYLKLNDSEWKTTVHGNNMVFNDWKALNMHYKCSEKCAPISCENGGFQNSHKCEECVCPRFHEGTRCEKERDVLTISPGKLQGLLIDFTSPWSEKEKAKDIIDDRYFKYSPAQILKSPEGTRIRINIFAITDPFHGMDNAEATCNQYGLEIAEEDLTRVGKRYCSWKKKGHSFLSKSNVIGYLAYSSPGFGFGVSVSFTVEESQL